MLICWSGSSPSPVGASIEGERHRSGGWGCPERAATDSFYHPLVISNRRELTGLSLSLAQSHRGLIINDWTDPYPVDGVRDPGLATPVLDDAWQGPIRAGRAPGGPDRGRYERLRWLAARQPASPERPMVCIRAVSGSSATERSIRHYERVPGNADPSVQRFRRAFHWGALLIMDASSTDVPTQPAESGVATTDAGLMVPVRHAQDVDFEGLGPDEVVPPFEVEVEVHAGPSNGPVSTEHTAQITSGVLSIGDADDEIRVDVEPGRVRITVYLDDPRHAERVRIWLTPDTGA